MNQAETKEFNYNAVIGHWETCVLHGVSREELDAYCAAKGLIVYSVHRVGLTRLEVVLVKT